MGNRGITLSVLVHHLVKLNAPRNGAILPMPICDKKWKKQEHRIQRKSPRSVESQFQCDSPKLRLLSSGYRTRVWSIQRRLKSTPSINLPRAMSIRKNWKPIRNRWCRLSLSLLYISLDTPVRLDQGGSFQREDLRWVSIEDSGERRLGWCSTIESECSSAFEWTSSMFVSSFFRNLIRPRQSLSLLSVQHRKVLSNVINRTMRSSTNLTTLKIRSLIWITTRSKNTNEKWFKTRCANKVSQYSSNERLTRRIDSSFSTEEECSSGWHSKGYTVQLRVLGILIIPSMFISFVREQTLADKSY